MSAKKILLIEDDPDHAELILDTFDIEDVENDVILMKDGQDAVDYFQHTGSSGNVKHTQIGLVILDLNLPKVNGMDILKFLKGNPEYHSIKVVILSTNSDQETISEAYRNGADDYVTKPASYDEFIEKMELLMSNWFMSSTLPGQD